MQPKSKTVPPSGLLITPSCRFGTSSSSSSSSSPPQRPGLSRLNLSRIMIRNHISAIGFLCLLFFCNANGATDTISSGQSLGVSGTVVSSGGEFELGFFSPGNATFQYLGIWFKKVQERTVVWVANREFPLITSSPSLVFAGDGNLVIHEGRITYAVTNATTTSGNATATLLDSGNFVLKDGVSGAVLWQSFDFPSHTLLPGMKLGYDERDGKIWSLTSWKSLEDPRPGAFSMQLDPDGISQLLIMQGSKIYWTSGEWNGRAFGLVPEEPLKKLNNISYVSSHNQSYFMFTSFNTNNAQARIILDVSGQVKELTWSNFSQQWVLNWSQPSQQCQVFAYCGSFGICTQNLSLICSCVSGFVPRNLRNWNLGDMSEGCVRKVPLICPTDVANANASSDEDGFRLMSHVLLPVNPVTLSARNAFDCKAKCLDNCSCSSYAYDSHGCHTWGRELNNLQQLSEDDATGKDLYVKFPASELQGRAGSTSQWWFWLLLVLLLILILMLALGFFVCLRRRRQYQRTAGENLLQFDFEGSHWSTGSCESHDLGIGVKKDVELPLFSFASVSAATGDFSVANKLGEGGFGPVYKGKLQKGNEVAVKRLSRKSGQGWEELKNEATLIAKLQHKNLVRLLGCCLERDEKILIYEYLHNKSLDSFLFDPTKRHLLDWRTRTRIISGVCQGLLYLHEYSRLKIIHRDLKASNILLDKDMNPKISDFGMARIFGGDEALATNRIVGTYGYMSPEYAMDGIFSVKSDVFSFGILLLEILSGKKNTGLFTTDSLNLLGSAWDLWKRGNELELMDSILEDKPAREVQSRYVTVALLCVQEVAADRPAMPDVISMLTNESQVLLTPKLPMSSIMRSIMGSDTTTTTILHSFSQNELTRSTTKNRSYRTLSSS